MAAVRVPRRSHAQLHARARPHSRIRIRACAALVFAALRALTLRSPQAAPGAVAAPSDPLALGAAVAAAVAAAPPGATTVLLACPSAAALPALRAALAAAAPAQVVILAPQAPEAQAAAPALLQRRTLLQTRTAPVVCDAVCTAQTSLLMFAATMLLIIVMALSGVCCLHALQGPGRFEVSKEQGHAKDN